MTSQYTKKDRCLIARKAGRGHVAGAPHISCSRPADAALARAHAEFGFRGLFDRRRGKPSPKRVPVAMVERVLELYREKYFDLNVRHFHEELRAVDGLAAAPSRRCQRTRRA